MGFQLRILSVHWFLSNKYCVLHGDLNMSVTWFLCSKCLRVPWFPSIKY